MNSRPRYRPVWHALLSPFIRDGLVSFGYRCDGQEMKASLRLSDIASDIQVIWELCVSDTYEVDRDFAPNLVIDGGGNIGLFTLRTVAALASASGTSPSNLKTRFVIVEPLQRNIDQIQKHLNMNSVHADLQKACLGGSLRTIPFYCREAIRSSFSPQEAYLEVIHLPVLRLQDVIGSSDAERIFIKLDIEGMELETLAAFVPSEQRAVYILGELHDYAKEADAMQELFNSSGWTLEFFEIADNYAHFRACSPAALPLLPTMAHLLHSAQKQLTAS